MWRFLKKLEIDMPYDPAIPLLGIHTRRIKLNIWYVDHVSFLLDLRIFFTTIGKVFSNADNQNDGATVVRENQNINV